MFEYLKPNGTFLLIGNTAILCFDDRCLEEGAEDFLVKPVKLSDVERLRDYMLKGEEDNKVSATHKRKIDDDLLSLPPARELEEDPSSVLPTSLQLLPTHLSCDLSASGQAFSSPSSAQSLSKRPRLID